MNAAIEFCEAAIKAISPFMGDKRLTEFVDWRYHQFNRFFPHQPFTIAEGDMNFFEKTLDYLKNPSTIPLIDKETLPYKKNYIEWLRVFSKTSQ